jgi:hypothetical protein
MTPTMTLNMGSEPFTQSGVRRAQREESERKQQEKQVTHSVLPFLMRSRVWRPEEGLNLPHPFAHSCAGQEFRVLAILSGPSMKWTNASPVLVRASQ